jgi:hypothetical protein
VTVTLESREEPRARNRVLRYFPVTFLLTLQYGLFVVLPGVRNGRTNSVVLTIICVGLVSSLTIEVILLLAGWQRGRTSRKYAFLNLRSCMLLTAVGFTAISVSFILSESYATQVGQSNRSAFEALLSPFVPWAVMGPVLIVFLAQRGEVARNRAVMVVAVCILVRLGLSILDGITASGMTYGFVLSATALLFGVIRMRTLVVLLLLAFLLWPLVAGLRNETRVRLGADSASIALMQSASAERLDLDRLMTRVDRIPEGSLDIETPGVFDVIRYGLVPRFLDQGRPVLWTSREISSALGGSYTNSDTLTLFGNLYAGSGFGALVMYCSAAAVAIGASVRTQHPLGAVFFAGLVGSVLWIESTVPDNLVGFLQACVSVLLGWLALRAFGFKWRSRAPRMPN